MHSPRCQLTGAEWTAIAGAVGDAGAINLDVSTLADWVGACAATLMPLVERIRDHVFTAERIHADDTMSSRFRCSKNRERNEHCRATTIAVHSGRASCTSSDCPATAAANHSTPAST